MVRLHSPSVLPSVHGSSTGAGSSVVRSGVSGVLASATRSRTWLLVHAREAALDVVVHLQHDLAAGLDRHPGAFAERRLPAARCPGGQPGRVVEGGDRVAGGLDTRPAEAAPSGVVVGIVLVLGVGHALGVDPVDDRVVHDQLVVGEEAGTGQVGVGVEVRVEQEAAVVLQAAGRRLRAVCAAGQLQGDEAFALTQRCRRAVRPMPALAARLTGRRAAGRGAGRLVDRSLPVGAAAGRDQRHGRDEGDGRTNGSHVARVRALRAGQRRTSS